MPSILCRKPYLLIVACLFLAGMAISDKPAPVIRKLSPMTPVEVTPGAAIPTLRAGDTCTVNLAGQPAYYIYPWVIGDELYKAYQDPSVTCDKPYPFTVEYVYLPLIYLDTGTIYLSADVETADLTDPSCPKPGAVVTISSLYEVTLEDNFYLIRLPLDSVAVVNGPYFVGVYFADAGNPGAGAVVTDTIPVPCVGYNDWGEGYVDLDTVHNTETGEKIFPGRLIMYSSGITGGSGGDPVPSAQFIHPEPQQFLGTPIDLWANDAAGSAIIDRVRFQFNLSGSWFNIAYDASDNPVLRNGVDPSGSGNGLSYLWNSASVAEGDYQLRAIIMDTLGRGDTSEITVSIDPTPPFPVFTSPVMGENACDGITAALTCPDEDISYMIFETKSVPKNFTIAVPVISQQLGGDVDGDPDDGNYAADGEYGDYCSGPAAAAMAVKYWFNRGYNNILREGGSVLLTDAQLMDRLYSAMNIRENLGAYDEEFIAGLRSYIQVHGGQFTLHIDRTPSARDLYNWMGNYEYAVLAGLSGTPGLWMTATGAVDLADINGQYTFRMADPITGAVNPFSVKEEAGALKLFYGDEWKNIDILVGMVPDDWTVQRTALGIDVSGTDGWGYEWNTASLSSDSMYFLFVRAADVFGNNGDAAVLVQVDCTVNGVPGDVNHDGIVNAADVVFMTNFLYLGGQPPVGGQATLDVNCDALIGLSDVIYLFNYLFNSGPPPCP